MRGVVVGVMLTGCSFSPGALPDVTTVGDGSIDAPVQTLGWSTPIELVELNDPAGADDPSLTDDLREIYFGSRRSGGVGTDNEDIWMASRPSATEPFGAPVNVMALNSGSNETTMKITGDGLTIFFASNRGGAGHDIYMSTRTTRSSAWSSPTRIPELSTLNGDWGPFAQINLRRIVICSGITVASEALYVSERADATLAWPQPKRIVELDESGKSECDPMTPNPTSIYYGTDYRNADGTFDIYRAQRTTETQPYGLRAALDTVNLPAVDDRDPWVSADERTMVFTSNRNGRIDGLYITTR